MNATSLSASKNIALLLLVAFAHSVNAAATVIVEHDLTVNIDPNHGHMEVVDRIRLPGGQAGAEGTVDFYLNAAFQATIGDTSARLEPLGAATPERLRRYRVHFSGDAATLTVRYSGRLTQPEGAYEFGHLGPEGVYLTEASAWYPMFDDALVRFSMAVRAPEGWTVVSQGAGAPAGAGTAQRWRESRPQTEIVLLAGRFTPYTRNADGFDTQVYLRRADAELAGRYLDAAAHYVDLYSRLLGPYPYEKFALVENFWETGYGMPSLAVMGPRVIRFPFILHSSYPHEILHNWWGNGVYPSHAGGNWSEGLTAYLADHLVQEERGRGADYRRAALQKYASYVDAQDDFPLSAFRGKHGEVSQAVGYNKALMFFHMLRQHLGDEKFLQGLRLFAARHPYSPAGYADLRRAFEAAAKIDLAPEFRQWVERTGAPRLLVTNVNVAKKGGDFKLSGVIEQVQAGAAYRLNVPVAVQIRGRARAERRVLTVVDKRHEFSLVFNARPVALHADPEFDVFRRLSAGEAPASLGDLLGAKDVAFVLPAGANNRARHGYAHLARALGDGVTVEDSASLPSNASVWLLGWDNAHLGTLAGSLAESGVALTKEGLKVGAQFYPQGSNCVVMAARGATSAKRNIGFIGCDNKNAIPGLGRKIPHYGKYGLLAFEGDEPTNVIKQEWPARNSPMTIVLDPDEARLPPALPQRTSLAGTL